MIIVLSNKQVLGHTKGIDNTLLCVFQVNKNNRFYDVVVVNDVADVPDVADVDDVDDVDDAVDVGVEHIR